MSKTRIYHLLCGILVCIMVLVCFPAAVHAASTGTQAATWSVLDRGTCGNGLTWELADNGTLTISGSGAMNDYTYTGSETNGYTATTPWAGYAAQITNVVISDGVTRIGGAAFLSCEKLTDITIPSSVTSIGKNAFRFCNSLATVTIPDEVTQIEQDAFGRCNGLTAITIPKGITTIEQGVFFGCGKLTSVVIQENVTSIEKNAFRSCSSLTSVIMPKSLTSIGAYAFSGCSSLTSIKIPKNVTSIGEYGFDSCTALKSVYFLGDGFTGKSTIFRSAVTAYYPHGNTTWTDSIRSTFGSNVSWRESEIIDFGTCGDNLSWELRTYTGSDLDLDLYITGSGRMYDYEVTDEGSSAPWYAYKNKIRKVILPDGITNIGNCAFYGCSVSSVTLPDSLEVIGDSAFSGTRIDSITIPEGVTAINPGAFSGCTLLKTVSLPDGLETIGDSAFVSCWSLHIPQLPKNLSSIGKRAFAGCSAMTSITIPEGITTIAEETFCNCISLKTVTLPESLENIQQSAFSGCSALTSITIPEGITVIKDSTFKGCKVLEKVTLPESLTTIESNAFENCGMTRFTVPAGVRSIGDNAFAGCEKLTYVDFLGDGFTGGAIFPQLVLAYYPAGNPTWTKEIGDSFTVTPNWIPQRSSSGSCGENLTFTVSSDYKELTITGSGDMLNYELYDVAAHNSTCVPPWWESIASVSLPEGLTSIGSAAFYGCKFLTSVTIPETVSSVGVLAFENCTGLTDVTISNGVSSIQDFAFCGCTGLTSVTVPGSVTDLGTYAFFNCTGLTGVTLSENLTAMKAGTFSGCSRLTTIRIPRGVNSIEYGAFENCAKLSEIHFDGHPSSIDPDAFTGVTAVVYYPFDAGWTADELQNYGGNLTWQVVKPNYAAPTVTTTKNYGSGVLVEWDAVEGATGYVVYRRAMTKNSTTWTTFARWNNTTNLSFLDTKVYEGTKYQYGVKAYYGSDPTTTTNLSPVGPMSTALVYAKKPAAPASINAVKTAKGVKLTWSEVKGATGYVVYRRAMTKNSTTWTAFARWNNTTALTFTDTKLYAGTKYQYGVKAYYGPNPADMTYVGPVSPMSAIITK